MFMCVYLFLQSNMDRLGAKRQLKMAHGVASGMAYLASKEYVHRVSLACIN